MIRAIIFDFDGVILESAEIKTKAFRQLFERDFPDKVSAIVEYHEQNMGISRFTKFEYIYREILDLPFSHKESEKLGLKFYGIVFNSVLVAPFVKGAREFLSTFFEKYEMFVVSGTPECELIELISKRGIQEFFRGVYGSPLGKSEAIKKILRDFRLRNDQVVLIGDADSDMRAAGENGIYFIARTCSYNDGGPTSAARCIKDLTELENTLAVL